MNTRSSKLWVGAFLKTGALVVFDPELQIPGQPEVNLFSVNLNSIRPFEANVARSKLSSAQGEALELALSKYSAWRLLDDGHFLRNETNRLNSEKLKRQELREEADRRAALQASAEASRAEEAIRSRQAEQVEARSTLEDRHRARLQEGGEAYLGVRVARKGHRKRVAHCYACKEVLDNTIDLECSACGWILCLCSACGCGYIAVRADA